MASEIKIGAFEYQIGRLDAMKQFHLARRISPMFAALVTASKNAFPEKAEDREAAFVAMIAGPIAEELSKKSDEEMDHIVFPCLGVVKRKDPTSGFWMNVKTPGQNSLMYSDLDGATIVKLTMEVIQENLSSFFPSAQPAL